VRDVSPDADLLARHVAGDPVAFGELVHQHRDRLWAVALRTLGHPQDAEDALQNALLSAFRSAGSFRGDAAVTTWLHRIVVNACLDLVRRRSTRPTDPMPETEPPDRRDAVAEVDTAIDVAAALATLPIEQRLALVLVDVTGHSVEDAARILEVPAGTVKSRCARGRARLAPQLAHLRGGNPAAGRDVGSVTGPLTGPNGGAVTDPGGAEEVNPGHVDV